MHEQSETEQDPTTGQWGTVYGRNTLNAGQQIPGTRQFPDIDTALADAKLRSMMENTSPAEMSARTLPQQGSFGTVARDLTPPPSAPWTPWSDELRQSALARQTLPPGQRAMRFDAYGRETPIAEPPVSEHDLSEIERAQFGGIAVRLLPPRAIYHGSPTRGLTTLDAVREGYSQGAVPAWFSEATKLAKDYARGGPLYKPRNLKLERPLILTKDMNSRATLDEIRKDSGLNFQNRSGKVEGVPYRRWTVVTSPEFVDAAKAAGYDGIRVSERGMTTWGVLKPTPVVPRGQQRPARDILDPEYWSNPRRMKRTPVRRPAAEATPEPKPTDVMVGEEWYPAPPDPRQLDLPFAALSPDPRIGRPTTDWSRPGRMRIPGLDPGR